jgi:hypothetical protein
LLLLQGQKYRHISVADLMQVPTSGVMQAAANRRNSLRRGCARSILPYPTTLACRTFSKYRVSCAISSTNTNLVLMVVTLMTSKLTSLGRLPIVTLLSCLWRLVADRSPQKYTVLRCESTRSGSRHITQMQRRSMLVCYIQSIWI